MVSDSGEQAAVVEKPQSNAPPQPTSVASKNEAGSKAPKATPTRKRLPLYIDTEVCVRSSIDEDPGSGVFKVWFLFRFDLS